MIAVDASRANLEQKTGTEYYSAILLKELAKIDRKNHYRLYAQGKGWVLEQNWPANFEVKIIESPLLWTQLCLSREMSKVKPEVLFVPAHAVPFIHPKKTIVTIHDLAYEFYPSSYRSLARSYLKFSTRLSAQWASDIIVPSKATKKDLINLYKVNSEKIHVIPHGYNNQLFKKIDNPHEVGLIKKKYGLNENDDYLFFVGRLDERKNIIGIVKAFYKVKSQTNFDYKLVLAGKAGVGYEKMQQEIRDLLIENEVNFLGYVPERDLPYLMNGATIFLFPSLYEGFGFPILEAMACGVPVITSKTSSCLEVAGEAAILVNPDNIEEIAESIIRLIADARLRMRLVQQGFRQIEKFSWRKTAEETLRIIQGSKLIQ